LILASRMTFRHFSMKSTMNFAKSAAPLPTLRFPNYALRTPSAAGKITRSSVRQ
jgi:hypothetical protein